MACVSGAAITTTAAMTAPANMPSLSLIRLPCLGSMTAAGGRNGISMLDSSPTSPAQELGGWTLDVEADVQDVAVLDHVGLAFEPLRAAPRRLGVRAGVEQVAPRDRLGADEAARDVGVDRRGGVERRLAAPQRPGPRLLLARGEERDQVERVARAAARSRRAPTAPPGRRRPPPRAAPRARPRAGGRFRPAR